MKRKEVDYNKYDILDIYAKEDRVETITKCYESFCWELIEKNENNKYADTIELTFIRPHIIPQKDYLQYTQIEMENTLNSIGKLDRTKYSKSTALSLFLGLLSLIFILIGSHLIFNNLVVYGISLIIMGVIGCVITTVIAIKLHKLDDNQYKNNRQNLEHTLETICQNVKKVVNDNANKD